jgi:long-chain acyl-CoA synthetase
MPAPDMPASDLPVTLQDIEQLGADTFSKLLLRQGLQRGQKPAIREKYRGIWRTLTWRDLAEEVAALAGALSTRGLRRGAHVAFVGDNRPRLYAAMGAAQWLGAVAVPLYQDASAEEMVVPLQCAEATHVFAENQEQVDKLLTILPRCPTIQCIVYDKDRGMRHYRQPLLVSYADLLREGREFAAARADALRAEVARGSGQDAAFLFFTSGTIGPAKAVVLTHDALIDRARAMATTEGLKDSDLTMAYLSPGWSGQCLFSYVLPMVVGHCVCCPESSDSLLADMREMSPTFLLATPAVLEALRVDLSARLEDTVGFSHRLYRRGMAAAQRIGAPGLAADKASMADRIFSGVCGLLINAPLRDVLGMGRARVVYTAGDAVAPGLLTFFRALGINLKQLYGSTETGSFVAIHRDGDVKPDTVGRPGEGVELKIAPNGEILVRSPGLLKEYHRNPEATARARDAEGWFRTGDAGSLDEDGHLRIIDRMIHLGAFADGAPFAPKPIENRLKFSPYIKQAVVFGDGRDRACALIDIDGAAVGRWADKHNISYTGQAELAAREEVHGLIADCIAEVNAELALDPRLARAQIHRFLILQKEFHADDGLLTRTGKLRRNVVAEHYGSLVEAMYEGRAAASIEVDGILGDLKIRDAKVIAPAHSRRAA